METLDITRFIEENKTPKTIAYDYHLQIIYMVAKEMDKQGINKKELAKRMGVNNNTISRLFKGDKDINFKTLAKLDKALGLNIVFTRKGENND